MTHEYWCPWRWRVWVWVFQSYAFIIQLKETLKCVSNHSTAAKSFPVVTKNINIERSKLWLRRQQHDLISKVPEWEPVANVVTVRALSVLLLQEHGDAHLFQEHGDGHPLQNLGDASHLQELKHGGVPVHQQPRRVRFHQEHNDQHHRSAGWEFLPITISCKYKN